MRLYLAPPPDRYGSLGRASSYEDSSRITSASPLSLPDPLALVDHASEAGESWQILSDAELSSEHLDDARCGCDDADDDETAMAASSPPLAALILLSSSLLGLSLRV